MSAGCVSMVRDGMHMKCDEDDKDDEVDKDDEDERDEERCGELTLVVTGT